MDAIKPPFVLAQPADRPFTLALHSALPYRLHPTIPREPTASRRATSYPATMCVAGLNASTQPCHHRWYELIRSCSDERDLSNCPSRLQLEGWENRTASCPWCDGDGATSSTHRLFGSASSASGSSTHSSPVITPMSGKPQLKRCDTDSTLSSLSRTGSFATNTSERGQKHRERNDRLHLYLTTSPHEVLPSAAKNYPACSVTPTSSDSGSIRSTRKLFGAGWRRSVRFGRSMFAS